MSKTYKYTCNHIYKKTSLLSSVIIINDLCPSCKKKLEELIIFQKNEIKNNLHPFTYTSTTIPKALTASQTRFKLLYGYSTRFLTEKGLLAYLEALRIDTRPYAKTLIKKTEIIINSNMDFWYSCRNKTCADLIKYIEIGDIE